MHILNRRTALFVAAGVIGAIGVTASRAAEAEIDMAKVLPGPSVIYVGWSGTEAACPAFEKTALGQLLAEPEVKKLTEALCPQVSALVKAHLGGGGESKRDEQIKEALGILSRHPGAINVMRLMLQKTGLEIQAAFVAHLGADAGRFEELLTSLLGELLKGPEGGAPPLKTATIGASTLTQHTISKALPILSWGRVGEYYILTAGTDTPKKVIDRLLGQSETPPLIENDNFSAARVGLKLEGKTTVLNWYVSLSDIFLRLPLVATVIDLQRSEGRPKQKDALSLGVIVGRTIRALDLRKLKSLSGAVSIEEDGFRIAWYLHAPDTQTGLMKFFHQKPLTEEDLAAVPREANIFYATNLDLPGFYEAMMSALKEIDPKLYQGWVDLIAEGERVADVKLIEDVLAPLDDGWVFYNAPVDGGGWSGMVLLIEAKDVAHAEKSLTALAQTVVEHLGGAEAQIVTSDGPGGKPLRQIEDKTGSIPAGVIPAWSTAGKYLVIGIDPRGVSAAVARLNGGGTAETSILKREDFATRRKYLPSGANALGYLDGKDVLGWAYRMAVALLGVGWDPSLIPKRETVEKHLFGMVTALVADEGGALMVSHAPLPLPTPTARWPAAVVGAIALAEVFGDRVKEDAASSDLPALGKACHVYAARHEEKFPQTLDALVAEQLLPSGAAGLTQYEYVSGLSPYDPDWFILAYDKASVDKGAQRARVLLVTGKCIWMPAEELTQTLEKARGQLATRPATTTQTGAKP
ncbi:MAG: hypothetical protein JXQ73_11830 [Phycisphaerae bacterium]|nr:hypothetical protein [Phycisphaerae bacterium]